MFASLTMFDRFAGEPICGAASRGSAETTPPAHTIRRVEEAFYEKAGGGFVATELTRGPWDPGAQHAGPPSGLLGREIERVEGGEGFQVARVTFEILWPVPIGPVTVEAEVVRPGRSVQMVEASLRGEDGTELIRARAWRIREAETC